MFFCIILLFAIAMIFGNDSVFMWIPVIIIFFPLPLLFTGVLLEELEKRPKWWVNHNKSYFILMAFIFSIGVFSLILGSVNPSMDLLLKISLFYLAGLCFYINFLIFSIRKKGSQ